MLVGETPVGWPSPEDSRLGRFFEAPADHRSHLDRLPGRVEQCLTRALALRAADRFQSPGEFVEALATSAKGRDPIPDEEMHAILARAAETAYPDFVDAIQEELGIVGHVSTVGHVLTWSPASQGTESRKIVITLRPRDGVTALHVEEQNEMAGWRILMPGWGAGAGGLFGLAVTAVLGLPEPAILVTALPAAIFGALATVRGMINTRAQNASPQLQRVRDRLTDLVRRDAAPDVDPAPLRER